MLPEQLRKVHPYFSQTTPRLAETVYLLYLDVGKKLSKSH